MTALDIGSVTETKVAEHLAQVHHNPQEARAILQALIDLGFVEEKTDPVTGETVYEAVFDITTKLNLEPLLVNLVNTWQLRPDAFTQIPNLFLASDYVRTNTDLATMEGANEAARRAVNAIIEAAGVCACPCKIWELHEPEIFAPFRLWDKIRYQKGLPWDERFFK